MVLLWQKLSRDPAPSVEAVVKPIGDSSPSEFSLVKAPSTVDTLLARGDETLVGNNLEKRSKTTESPQIIYSKPDAHDRRCKAILPQSKLTGGSNSSNNMYDNRVINISNRNSPGQGQNNSNTNALNHPGTRDCYPHSTNNPPPRGSDNDISSHQNQTPQIYTQYYHHPHQYHHHHYNQQQHPHPNLNSNHHQHQHQHHHHQQQQPNNNGASSTTTTTNALVLGGGSRGSHTKGNQPQQQQQQNHLHSSSSPTSFVLHKLSGFSKRKSESDRRKVAERELDNLNSKIDKLLSKMGEPELETHAKLNLEEECVVCLAAPACMQTFPCGHKVVCRKCLIKTIQVAVSQRCLPLRCVICRNRILRLQHTSAKNSSLTHHHHQQQQQQRQQQQQQQQQQKQHQHQQQVGDNGLSSHGTPASSIAPGFAAAGALTLTPIVIRSLTGPGSSANQCLPISVISAGTLQSPTGGQRWPKSSIYPTAVQGAHSFDDHPSFYRDSSAMQEVGQADDFWKRSSPPASDMEAFVSSHNDALNLHSTKPQLPTSMSSASDQSLYDCSSSNHHHQITHISRGAGSWKPRPCLTGKKGSTNVTHGGSHETRSGNATHAATKAAGVGSSPALGFMHGQGIKVHPETMAQPSAFLMSPDHSGLDPGLVSSHVTSPFRFPKSNISASKFIAKFLPKTSRRKYSWFRQE